MLCIAWAYSANVVLVVAGWCVALLPSRCSWASCSSWEVDAKGEIATLLQKSLIISLCAQSIQGSHRFASLSCSHQFNFQVGSADSLPSLSKTKRGGVWGQQSIAKPHSWQLVQQGNPGNSPLQVLGWWHTSQKHSTAQCSTAQHNTQPVHQRSTQKGQYP